MSNIPAISKMLPETAASEAVATAPSSGFSDAITKKLKVPADLNALFEEAAQKYNVPSGLLKAVGKAESNFNPRAVSHAGAQGVMQLMPATARGLGVTNSFDARQNIMGGAKYLSDMLKKYNGNTKLALAAYNAGSNNVDKYHGIPPFKETQNYVEKVMGYIGQEMGTVPSISNYTSASGNRSATTGLGNSSASAHNSDDAYRNILESIFDFDHFTTEDYMLFLELLKGSMNTSAMGQTLGTADAYGSGLFGNRIQTLF